MTKAHYFYAQCSVIELEQIMAAHREKFETLMEDSFSEAELLQHEKLLDSIATVIEQPILDELSFDDFYPDANLQEAEKQKSFFASCRSSLCLDHLPYLEMNPFQVTYLIMLVEHFSEVLIDRGGVSKLVFKAAYLHELKRYRTIEVLMKVSSGPKLVVASSRPVSPIDFLVHDVYKELERLQNLGTRIETIDGLSEKTSKILTVMIEERRDATAIFKKSGLIPKDFDDHLEKLKFKLRKL